MTMSRSEFRKEHVKSYKSGKLWMSALIGTVAVAGMATTATAHADAVTTTPASDNTTETVQLPSNATTDTPSQTSDTNVTDEVQTVSDQNVSTPASVAADTNVTKAVDTSAIDQQISDTQSTVNADQQNVDKTQQQITDAYKQNEAKKDAINQAANEQVNGYQSQINDLKDKATQDASESQNTQINNVQSQLDNAKTDVANTQSQISNTQSQITDLQKDHGITSTDTNVVSVPNGNLDKSASLLENTARNNLWDNYYSDEQPASDWNKNLIPNNIYVSPDSNKTEDHSATAPVDFGDEYLPYQNDIDQVNESTGMTESQMRELSILLLNEINHARAQRGLAPFVMTEGQFQHAMARARQDSAANLEHNGNDMNSALGSNWHSENLALVDADGGTNMLSLLANANNSVSSMLITDADSAWGHRNNFLDDGNYNAAFGFRLLDNGFYVMTFDTTYASDADKANDLVANTINNYAAMGPVKASTTAPIDHTNEINKLKKHLSDLNRQLDAQQKTANNLQSQLDSLKNQEIAIPDNVQSQIKQLQDDIETTKQKQNEDLANAQSDYEKLNNDLNDKLSDFSAKLAQDQDKLNQLKSQRDAMVNNGSHAVDPDHGTTTPTEPSHNSSTSTDTKHDGSSTSTTPSNTHHDSSVSTSTDDTHHDSSVSTDTKHDGSTTPSDSDNSSSTPSNPDGHISVPGGHAGIHRDPSTDGKKDEHHDDVAPSDTAKTDTQDKTDTKSNGSTKPTIVLPTTDNETTTTFAAGKNVNFVSTSDVSSDAKNAIQKPVAWDEKSDAKKSESLPQTSGTNGQAMAMAGLALAAGAATAGYAIVSSKKKSEN